MKKGKKGRKIERKPGPNQSSLLYCQDVEETLYPKDNVTANHWVKGQEILNSKPYDVIGGFHLGGQSLNKITSMAQELVETGLKRSGQ